MKLSSTFNKLPLIAVLSLGLACSPLVASADDSDRGRHGRSQQDRGKSHYKADHRDRHSYRKGYKHGYRDRRHKESRYAHNGHPYYRHQGHYYDHGGFMLSLYSDNLDIIFLD